MGFVCRAADWSCATAASHEAASAVLRLACGARVPAPGSEALRVRFVGASECCGIDGLIPAAGRQLGVVSVVRQEEAAAL